MTATYDAVVIGLGGFGSGAFHHLARRGVRVLGIDRFGIAHDRGSSHGETRIIRRAYFEHPDYVPLVDRAYEAWAKLERESGRSLYQRTGLLLAGPASGEAISGTRLAEERYGVGLDELPLDEARTRFPGFRFRDDDTVLFERDAGFLRVEDCVAAHVELGRRAGGEVRLDEPVVGWDVDGESVWIRTADSEFSAGRLIVTTGAWSAGLLANVLPAIEIRRKVQFWFEPRTREYDLEAGTPAAYFDRAAGDFYGFPCHDGRTLKVAQHTGGTVVADPAHLDRQCHPDDVEPVAAFLRGTLPGVNTEPVRHSVCMYAMSPDGHFVVDRHPRHPQVVLAAGFSGHGFKFTSVLGRVLAELALDGTTEEPIGFLGLGRFGAD